MAAPSMLALLVLLGTLCGLLAVVLVVLLHGRYRRQMQALLERIAELEAVRPAAAGETVPEAPEPAGESVTVAPEAVSSVAPSADVLAGRTSYVRRMVEGAPGEALTLADQAIVRVHNRLAESLTPQQLADDLFVSLRTLERGLAASLGCTPSQLILAVRMREARQMLLSGRYRVNEVASRLGFASPFHFSSRFKSFYRVAPSRMIERAAGSREGSGRSEAAS